ncbi:TM2 domain-containing protein [Flammeovirga pacifica]|uniref:TM2 domain-containing protein n=1 Tax=Flammeovirga pacifica TaxID=915059 RepID=A0A1S1Z593_FLAPC|nr:NINE protein [Flammeovirga pacifica]OHX68255.1 hypothetical protein NH26_18840 [Flammeovirga pacifica]
MKSTAVSYILCIFFGVLGIHRFYLGRPLSGILYLCTGGLFGIGWIVDLFFIPTMVEAENGKMRF